MARSTGQNNIQQRHSFLATSVHITMLCSLIYFQRHRDCMSLAVVSGDCLVQAFSWSRIHDNRLLKLNLEHGDSITTLGNLFLFLFLFCFCWFFSVYIFKWNFVCFSLCLLPLICLWAPLSRICLCCLYCSITYLWASISPP